MVEFSSLDYWIDDKLSRLRWIPQLAQATGENANAFWPKFKRAAHNDICKPGGFIHDQWAQYNDIARKDLAKISAAILTSMGIGSGNLLITVVPVGLWIFTALTHIGLGAFCDKSDPADS